MNELISIFVGNLENVGIGLLLFVVAYLSNIMFSMFYNIKVAGFKFDKAKLITGMIKMAVFGIGTALLCGVVTTLPIFATHVGFNIPEEFTDIFDNIVIVGAFLFTACKYCAEAVNKMKKIIDGAGESNEVSV